MSLGNFGGVKKIEYSTASDMSSAVDLLTPREDSPGLKNEVQETPEANGQTRYAGVKKEKVFHISDMSKFSALETLMKANTEIYVRVTDLEGNTEVFGPSKPKVNQITQVAPGDTVYFALKGNWYSV